MNARNLAILYRKEMTDFLRDKRTIVSMILAPMVVGPVMTVGMGHYMRKSKESAQAERYQVGIQGQMPGIREAVAQAGLEVRDVPDARAAVEGKQVSFGIQVDRLAPVLSVKIYSDNSEMRIGMAQGRIREALNKLRDGMVLVELEKRQVHPNVLRPFNVEAVNIAQPRKMTGAILGGVIGFILLIFLFNGAMYAAVDTTAGEKERRTLEILLASPAGRDDIVAAKVLNAVTAAIVTGVLSFLSYVAAFASMRSKGGEMAELVFPTDAATIGLMILAMIPVALLGASLAIAIATPARSAREAMSYLTPGLFVVMFLGASSFFPGTQQFSGMALIPVANFSTMLRNLMQGEWSWTQYGLTFAANTVYASLATLLAVRKFQDERILLRS